jgi:hypothetical protein
MHCWCVYIDVEGWFWIQTFYCRYCFIFKWIKKIYVEKILVYLLYLFIFGVNYNNEHGI